MKIRSERIWRDYDMRTTCVKHGYYTRGNNEEYRKMLDMVERTNPTPKNIYKVAQDILDHSDPEMVGEVTNIMFIIEKEVVNTFYEVEE